MHKIVSVKVVERYKLKITFDSEESFIYDFEPDLWGEVFEPLKDQAYFARVSVDEFGTIAWPNGADYCADSLYMKMKEAEKLRSTMTG